LLQVSVLAALHISLCKGNVYLEGLLLFLNQEYAFMEAFIYFLLIYLKPNFSNWKYTIIPYIENNYQ